MHDFSSGLRYAAGAAGAGLPYVLPGVGATTGARLLGAGAREAAAAGFGANLAPMVGGEAERLRNDAVTAKLPVGQRALTSLGVGAANAALFEIPAAAQTERAIGAAGFAAKPGLNVAGGIAKDTVGSAVGMGAAGAGGEAIAQGVQNNLNPNRDTSGDNEALVDAGVGGTLGMLPLALPHAVAGNTVGAARSAVRDKLPSAVDAAGNLIKSNAPAAAEVIRTATDNVTSGAKKAVDTAKDWFDERAARVGDPDSKTLFSPQVKPSSIPPEEHSAWLASDDTARNAAATRKAQQYLSDDQTPSNVRRAAQDFLKGPKTDNAWQGLVQADKYAQTINKVKTGLGALGERFNRGVDGAKEALNNRENAQNVNSLADGSFDSILADKLFKHTGLERSDDILSELPAAVKGMKDWVSNVFSGNPKGDVKLTRGLTEAFKDPAAATRDTYDLMVKQGLIEPKPQLIDKLVKVVESRQTAETSDSAIVKNNLLPTAEAAHSIGKDDHGRIASDVKNMIASGKFDESKLDSLFGANKNKVIDALDKSREQEKLVMQGGDTNKTGADGRALEDDQSDAAHDELAQITTSPTDPNELPVTTKFHGPYEAGKDGPEAKMKSTQESLESAHGQVVKQIGLIDMLREQHAGRPEAFVQAVVDAVKKHSKLLTTDVDKVHPEVALNDKLKVLRAEDAGDKSDSIDVKPGELNSITPGTKSNVWAESIGKDGEYGDIGHSKVFFERVSIDKETGEVETKSFATSTNKLIKRMREAKKEGAFTSDKTGVLDLVDMLKAGIGAMLTAKDADGRPATSGRVGFMDKPGGKVVWADKLSKLPDGLKLPSGEVVGEASIAQRDKINRENKVELKDWLTKNSDATWSKEDERSLNMAEATKGTDNKRLIKELRRDKERADFVARAKEALNAKDPEAVAKILNDAKEDWGNEGAGRKAIATEKETTIVGKRVDKETGIQSFETKTETRHLAEGEEMSAAANKAEDNKVRVHDENGMEVQPRAQRTKPAALSPAQSKFITDNLAKGVPAFMKILNERNLDQFQRAGLLNAMGDLLRAKDPAMMAVAERAKSVIARLEGLSTSRENAQEVKQTKSPEFKKWFGDSKVVDENGKPKVMYHGTAADIETFKPKQADAIFITDNPHFAEGFSYLSENYMRENGMEGAKNILPLFVKAEKTFDYERKANVDAVLDKFVGDAKGVREALTRGDWADIERPEIIAAIKAAGFDSINVNEAGVKNLAVFDPAQLKSAVGNDGKFDATDPRITHNEQSGTSDAAPISKAEQKQIREDVQKRLGKGIAVDFAESLFSSKDAAKEISGEWQDHLMRISLKAQDPTQVAAHESYHEFFSRLNKSDIKDAKRVQDILNRAANSEPVVRQISRLLDEHPNALAQIKEGATDYMEERQAYMYQFWQAGLLKVGPETKTTFKKISDFLRRVSGLLSNEQKAEKLLQAFDDGKTQTADAAAKVLAKNIEYRENVVNASLDTFKPVVNKLSRFLLSNESILMKSNNPHFQTVLREFKNVTGEATSQSYIEAKGQKMAQFMNKFEKSTRGYEQKDLELASKYLHMGDGTKPNDPVAREIYTKTRALLDEMNAYLRDSGVKVLRESVDKNGKTVNKWEDFGHRENYYPQAYDTGGIVKDAQGFKDDLYKNHSKIIDAIVKNANDELLTGTKVPDTYASSIAREKKSATLTKEDVLDSITNRIINAYGHTDLNESTSDIGFSPNARAVNQRSLDWLDKKAMGKWMNNDAVNVMTSYIAQGVKRAEYTKRFGNGGDGLSALVDRAHAFEKVKAISNISGKAVLEKDVDAALKALSADDQAKVETEALKAMQGPVKNIMAMEGTLGYDIDPTMRRIQGTAMAYENVRTMGTSLFSTLIDPLGILVRGGEMRDAWDAYVRGIREVKASWTGAHIEDKHAEIAEMLGTVDSGGFLANFGQAYSSLYLHKNVRAWNEGLFKWNGMEGINRGMRVSATQAALSFIKRQVEKPNAHSDRYLKELTLTKDDVQISKDGELNYSDPKIQVAVRRWVDGAILRPNAAQRTAWMSDPHYAVFAHMKQFAYTFHDVIMKRAWIEAKAHDNFGPMGILAATFTPMMIAADAAKSLLLSGEEPTWMHEGLGAEISHGARRAGLLGFATPYVDPLITGHPASMFGPTVEQATSAFTQPFTQTASDALPLSSVINTIHGGGNIDLMADD
ncbi:MAG: hypothetical protein QFB87_05320 [Patescibacteria group bacterium]|nr:hypothetical protein [Patescibacteria group bacterium]